MTLKIGENTYDFKYPNIGQMMKIESLKTKLSEKQYSDWLLSVSVWSQRALDYVDMCAYFTVLCPEIITDSKIDITNLDLIDAHKDVLQVFKKDFLPWWREFELLVNQVEEEASKDGKEG